VDVGRKKGLCHKHDFSLLQLDLEDLKGIGINDVQSLHIGLPSANMHRRK